MASYSLPLKETHSLQDCKKDYLRGCRIYTLSKELPENGNTTTVSVTTQVGRPAAYLVDGHNSDLGNTTSQEAEHGQDVTI